MVKIETKVKMPFLWGKAIFCKSKWTQVNLIVGPNGSGKTLLAQALSEQFYNAGLYVKFLKSESQNEKEVIEILKNNETIKTKVEAVLSSMFSKSITFADEIDGTFMPVVKNKAWNVEYNLYDVECHGLKEILFLLVNLYNPQNTCLIFDEPELHLHPQLQTFFMNEIRKEAKANPRRLFFLITHSPFFIDLRLPEDLLGVIVTHINSVPTHLEGLSDDDEDLFRRFLPRFNTYHKQFFFSDNQIFVEGYTDQQMFTYLLPYVKNYSFAAGTGIIDVGGKDELGVFFTVCSLLGTNGRIITDLDSLFSGKLRSACSKDVRVKGWLDKNYERQLEFYKKIFSSKELSSVITLEKLIYKLEFLLLGIGREINNSSNCSRKIRAFKEAVSAIYSKYSNAEGLDTFKTVVMQGINRHYDLLRQYLPKRLAATLPYIQTLFNIILAAFEASRVYILPKGCIEHYYIVETSGFMPVSAKDRKFHKELESILKSRPEKIVQNYNGLVQILERACK